MDVSDSPKSNQPSKPAPSVAAGSKLPGRSTPDRGQDLEAGLLTVSGGSEVPEAVRDASQLPASTPTKAKSGWLLWTIGGLVGAIALGGGGLLYLGSLRQLPMPLQAQLDQITGNPPAPATAASPAPDPNSLLGHLPYNEAPRSELRSIGSSGLLLRRSAARAYRNMESAARADGVNLVALSAFRSIEQQQSVFFNVKAERNQAATKRAEVSAPPGYSEHHTGYAIDIGDSTAPSTNLNQQFAQTRAFRWLDRHAARFNFELSFPEGNAQGVSYEPWHWRFVGDRDSLETFYKARQQTTGTGTPGSTASPSPTSSPDSSASSSPEPSAESSPESSPDSIEVRPVRPVVDRF